jgi:hypothetical protein
VNSSKRTVTSEAVEGDCARWGRRDLLILLVLVAGVSVFCWRGLCPGQTFLPVDLANNSLPWRTGGLRPLQNWLVSDPLYEFYPFLVHNVETLRGGHWPLWNPYILLGHPSVADPLAQIFYPVFSGLGLVFGPARGLAIGLWLHVALAAVLMYGFLRTIRCSRPGALLGAFTYALSGYLVTWFEQTYWIGTLAWLPGILWAFELAVQRRSLRHTALAGLLLGVAVLGGQFTFVVTFGLFLGLYAAGRTAELAWRRERVWAWPLLALVVAAGLGTLLSAVQTIPFADFLNVSQRVLARGLLDPFPWQQFVTLVVPDFYGNPATSGLYWGQTNFSEATIYAGLPALLLASLAPWSRRRFLAPYLGGVALVALYFVLGGPGISLLGTIPVLRYASLHRSVFLLPLLVAILAGLALSRPHLRAGGAAVSSVLLAGTVGLALALNSGQAGEHWAALQGPVFRAGGWLAAAVVFLWLRGRLPSWRRLADWSLVALVFADLFVFGSRFNPAGPVRELLPPTPAVQYLRANAGMQRVAVYQLDGQVVVGPNVLAVYGLADAGGYSSLVVQRFAQLVNEGDPKAAAVGVGRWLRTNPCMVFFNHPSTRLLDLLQAGYVVSPFPLTDLDATAWTEAYQGEVYIYRRLDPRPRAYVVYAAEYVPDDGQAVDRLLDESFDPANVAITAAPLDLPTVAVAAGHAATIAAYGDTEIVVAATAARQGLLVLGDQFYPGWQAEVDGRPVEIVRTNHVLRGVPLPAGEHLVVFRFMPASLWTGAALSLAGAVVLLLLLVFAGLVDRRLLRRRY